MAHISEGVVNSNELSHHDDDPRAYPFPCGQSAGRRLDSVSNGLRRWATRAHLAKNSWYPAYIKANKRYEELLLQTPEAYPFPFGEHKDKRLDVPEDTIWWGIHPSRSGNDWHQNLAEAYRLYLDKYNGYRLDDVYKRPGFIRFCLKPEHSKCLWYYKFKDLVQRYRIYLRTHRRPYHPRASAHVENPTGQLLGKQNDGRGSVEPDDDYERDVFVVDDDETIYQENGSDFEPANNTNDPVVDDDSDGHDDAEHADSESTENGDADRSVVQAEGLPPSHASANISQTSGPDPDDDIPLDELHNKTIIKRLFDGRKTKVTSSNNRRRTYHSSSGEETDTAEQPPPKRLRRRSEPEVHGPAQPDSHSDVESAALDEPETPHRDQLSQSLSALSLSQKSAGSPNNDGELPHAPHHDTRIARLGRRYRAPIQSDVEE
ncbi:uncharacterized protein BJ212DRAFT_1574335 [Suillus subaureus]|uniref:Uncharacterized protein n=1 Tax=Suillus subaureus TaxID=48587 RepID=A0A9P7EL42_9AGAM|nr:uncharacterized protein BJ212DRAFT_1574335 [Suillus subaureus]KAG1823735.1 hypothetical protein BJ212DRAFT_1574335 [Suillus subaureus]